MLQFLNSNQEGTAVYEFGKFLGYENVITLTSEQIANRTESNALSKANELIDAIANLSDAKLFLKRLCIRLIKNGSLP